VGKIDKLGKRGCDEEELVAIAGALHICAILADADARIDGCAPFVAVEDVAQCYGMSEPPDEARRTNDERTLGVDRGPGRLRSRR
jgi:hypothetical protein